MPKTSKLGAALDEAAEAATRLVIALRIAAAADRDGRRETCTGALERAINHSAEMGQILKEVVEK